MGTSRIRKTDIIFEKTIDINTVGNLKIAGVAVNASAAELNLLDGFVAAAAFSTTGLAGEANDARAMTVTLQDLNGAAVTGVKTGVFAWIASDANGSPSTGQSFLGISSTSGADVGISIELAQYYGYQLISSTDGLIDVVVTSTGSTTAKYLNLILSDGSRATSSILVFT